MPARKQGLRARAQRHAAVGDDGKLLFDHPEFKDLLTARGKCGKEWWSRTPVEDAMCPVCLRGHWCGKCTMDRLMRQQPQRLQRAIDAGEVAAAIHHHQTESSSDDEYDHHHRSCGCCAPQVLEEVRVRRYLCRRCGEMWWSASRPWCRNCALSFYAMLPKEV